MEKYRYKNLPIPGGGYVTGFVFSGSEKGLLYARTDIGGTYRFDSANESWTSLIDHVTMDDLSETFPIALALDDGHPERLFVVCGDYVSEGGVLAYSEDFGENFSYHEIPTYVHGNLPGRGTGLRLIVDKENSDRLFFAGQRDGLWTSADRGETWEKMPAMPEGHLTLVGQGATASVIFVGGAGVSTKTADGRRGHSLYFSRDGGKSFEPMWEPEDSPDDGVAMPGLVAQRYAMDEKYLYVTFSVMGRNAYAIEDGYSCDAGSVIGGRIVRYPLLGADGFGQGEEITPKNFGDDVANLDFGFSGISAAKTRPGMLVCSTISKEDGDCVLRSYDFGQTWELILYDLSVGKMDFRASYMKPRYNAGHSIIHWLSDIKINPFDEDEAWFNTGTGVFRTKNLTGDVVTFSDWCDGIEETVHLNIYSPPAGRVQLIDIVGDLGGFAFCDLDEPCDNSFDDADGNRYITCINADYSDENPDFVVVTPRGNWKGFTKGGLIISRDQCKTFDRAPMPFGISDKLDEALHRIETPNVNSGWAAVSPDCKNIVWSVAHWIDLPADMVIASVDGGKNFSLAKIYKLEENGSGEAQKNDGGFKVFSDRTDSKKFYGFGDHSDFYVSEDGGKTYHQRTLATDDGSAFPEINFAKIDCANKTEVRGECGRSGIFYAALGEGGLWKLDFSGEKILAKRLGDEGDIFYRMGLGIGREGGNYAAEPKAIYVAATIGGAYGFYRSLDDGKNFTRLNTSKQMFGEANSVEGDSRTFGRFYIATGSRGVLYGEPV
ncbi:MAG: endoglucanase [Clostridiales bacterium]|nr:endoglucanase [Clostridiales bacterium]